MIDHLWLSVWAYVRRCSLSVIQNSSNVSPLEMVHMDHNCRVAREMEPGGHIVGSDTSDRTVWLPLFRHRISSCTNLFWPEPNRTRHRIFTFVSLL